MGEGGQDGFGDSAVGGGRELVQKNGQHSVLEEMDVRRLAARQQRDALQGACLDGPELRSLLLAGPRAVDLHVEGGQADDDIQALAAHVSDEGSVGGELEEEIRSLHILLEIGRRSQLDRTVKTIHAMQETG